MSAVTPETARVLAFLNGRSLMPHLDPQEIAGVHVNREDEARVLRVDDLLDLVRRSILLDSLVAEVDRMGGIIAELRERLAEAEQ